jgi:putative transposase
LTDLYKNKYRIPSTRLQSWDYGAAGMYFITICTKHMQCFFGNIPFTADFASAKMNKTILGEIAESELLKSIEIRKDMNIEIAEYIIMPNHIHAIILIGENEFNSGAAASTDAMHRVSTRNTGMPPAPKNAFKPQSKNLASILCGYKSAVTTFARKNNLKFEWHIRFHDHIIRDEDEYRRIAYYIQKNPETWAKDKFYRK